MRIRMGTQELLLAIEGLKRSHEHFCQMQEDAIQQVLLSLKDENNLDENQAMIKFCPPSD